MASFGHAGHQIGGFIHAHTMAVDSKGNTYVAETDWGRRIPALQAGLEQIEQLRAQARSGTINRAPHIVFRGASMAVTLTRGQFNDIGDRPV